MEPNETIKNIVDEFANKISSSILQDQTSWNVVGAAPNCLPLEIGDLVEVGNLQIQKNKVGINNIEVTWEKLVGRALTIGIITSFFILDDYPCAIILTGDNSFGIYEFLLRKLPQSS